MEKVQVQVLGRSFRRTAPGGVLSLPRRDARILTALGRVGPVPEAPAKPKRKAAAAPAEVDVEFAPSEKLDVAPEKPKRQRTKKDGAKPKRANKKAE